METKLTMSEEICREIEKVFGKQDSFVVKMKYLQEVGKFISKIEEAHRQAEKSELTFEWAYNERI